MGDETTPDHYSGSYIPFHYCIYIYDHYSMHTLLSEEPTSREAWQIQQGLHENYVSEIPLG